MNHNTTNDVDLSKVYSDFKGNSVSFLVKLYILIKRNLIPLLILLFSGFIIGYSADAIMKKYKSTIIVSPNFNTVDYLYEKIKLIDSKLNQEDEDFLNQIGVNKNEISEISIKALPDIYTFVSNNKDNFDVFETLSENADASEVVENYNTAKNYDRHLIEIKSSHKISTESVKKIISYLNDSEYYEKMRKIIYVNVKNKISVNDSVVQQIDKIIESSEVLNNSASSVFINENNQLNDLVRNKLKIIDQNDDLKTHLYNLEYIITPISYFTNMNDNSSFLRGKLKFIVPLIFLILFLLFKSIKYLDRFQPNGVAK